jgi:hypothetical protein
MSFFAQGLSDLDKFERMSVELKILMRELNIPTAGEHKLIKLFNKYLKHPEYGLGYKVNSTMLRINVHVFSKIQNFL